MRLLLLDNRSAFAERLAAALSTGGLAQCECDSLSAFEHRIADGDRKSFDAIVLDLRREGHDALPLCRRIVGLSPDLPLVAVTAIDDYDEAVRLIQAGAEEVCLRDEFEADALRSRIRCAVERHRIQAMMRREIHAGSVTISCPAIPDLEPVTVGGHGCLPTAGETPLQLACVNFGNDQIGTVRDPLWDEAFGLPVEVTHTNCLPALVDHVAESPVDGIVMYLSQLDAEALDAIATIKVHCEKSVIVLTAPDPDGDLAVKAIRHGADDCLNPDSATHRTVTRYLRQGLARRRRQSGSDGSLSEQPRGAPRLEQRKSHYRQRSPRYYVTKSAIAIPIRPDLSPDQSVRAEGFTVDISESGIGFEIGALSQLPSELLLAGVEGDEGLLYFATVQVRNWAPKQGTTHVGAQFVSGARDLLREENLMPCYQSDTHKFATGMPEATLRKWVDMGIFQPVLVDRIYVCPKCGSMPTFRSGCRSCGSIHVAEPSTDPSLRMLLPGHDQRIRNQRIDRLPQMRSQRPGGGTQFRTARRPLPLPGMQLVGHHDRSGWSVPALQMAFSAQACQPTGTGRLSRQSAQSPGTSRAQVNKLAVGRSHSDVWAVRVQSLRSEDECAEYDVMGAFDVAKAVRSGSGAAASPRLQNAIRMKDKIISD